MTMQETQAGMVERAARTLAYWIETTPEERLCWCPAVDDSSQCRNAADQAREVIGLNYGLAEALSGKGDGRQASVEGHQPAEPAAATDRAALARSVRESGAALGAAIRKMRDDEYARVLNLGFGDFSAGDLIELALMNIYYHGGQINQIQLLYGDEEFRFPPASY